jgi:hypothetical protein
MEAGKRALVEYQPTEDEKRRSAYLAIRQATYSYAPRKPAWTKPHVWWPMRESYERERDWNTYYPSSGIDAYKRMGEHWPDRSHQLSYECFADFTYSKELRDKMQTQLDIEFDLMPEEDGVGDNEHLAFMWKIRSKKKKKQHNL